jgi:hypothetical protein
VDVDDGVIGEDWLVEHYGSLTIRGGDIGAGLYYRSEAKGLITGGNFHGVTFSAHSVAHFVGTNFLLDGEPIPGFTENGDSMRLFPLTEGSVLEATLLDGRTWDMMIGDTPVEGMPFTLDPTTILWLTVVPEPTTLVLALSALPVVLHRRRRRLPPIGRS